MIQRYLKDNIDTSGEQQIIPLANIKNVTSNKNAIDQNGLSNTRKMLLVEFDTDNIRNAHLTNQGGAQAIKVREDLIADLKTIKKELNGYNIPFSCQSYDVSLTNNYISDLGRVGLEIMLNPYAAMTDNKNPEYSDYYVGPDPVVKNKLKIYAVAYRDIAFYQTKYKPERKVIEIYDIRETYGKYPPKTTKVFKNVVDLSQILEDRGFIQRKPNEDFFIKSDNNKSNWFMFYKPLKINIGYTYRELLLTVYDDNGESIWRSSNRVWDGYKFNEQK